MFASRSSPRLWLLVTLILAGPAGIANGQIPRIVSNGSLGAISWSDGYYTVIFNTDAMTIDISTFHGGYSVGGGCPYGMYTGPGDPDGCARLVSQPGGQDIVVYDFTTVAIYQNNIYVLGSRPAAIAATGSIVIQGAITAQNGYAGGTVQSSGAGGAGSGPGAGGGGAGPGWYVYDGVVYNALAGGGGGGGGAKSAGAAGANSRTLIDNNGIPNYLPGGTSGPAYMLAPGPIVGGSGGGAGGDRPVWGGPAHYGGAAGGNGGGALILATPSDLMITGTISAAGSPGSPSAEGGGGGGGGGGFLLLQVDANLVNDGTISVAGGAGGVGPGGQMVDSYGGAGAGGLISIMGGAYTGSGTLNVTGGNPGLVAFQTETMLGNGTGSGTVTSQVGLQPAINCVVTLGAMSGACSQQYPAGTLVTLTAVPATGSSFWGWNGPCWGTAPCTVTVDRIRHVEGMFNLIPYPVTVTGSGTGSGTVTSQAGLVPAINCTVTNGVASGECSQNYLYGTSVTLTASAVNSIFTGWSGNCAGNGACALTVLADRTVTATFVGAPTVTGVLPASGPTAGGTSVAISGTKFQAGATVKFGGTAATGVTVTSSTSITATAPAHAAGAVAVAVTNPDSQVGTLPAAYTYVPPPTVATVLPASGPTAGGTSITITGTGFLSGASVTVGGATATNVVVVSATSITAKTPSHAAGLVSVTVTNPDSQAGTLPSAFTFVPPPTVIAVLPGSGTTLGSTPLTITGTNFLAGATVTIGGTPALSVVVASATSITAAAPAHAAGLVSVAVTNPDGQSAVLPNAFLFIAPPVIATVLPASGPVAGGTSITITGMDFAAGATVTVGGVAATGVAVVSATTMTATTPAHAAGAAAVVVVNPDGQAGTLLGGFTYNAPPGVTTIVPATGVTQGGTPVKITGTGFVAGAGVTVGGQAATNVVVESATVITAKTPAHAVGAVAVGVTNPDGQAVTVAAAFTYVRAAVEMDFDGDRIADLGTYRPSTGEWTIRLSSAQFSVEASLHVSWGASGDVLVPGDYDGDGRADVAVFRPATAQWWILPSSTGYDWQRGYQLLSWGMAGDVPAPGDYDGDGRTDVAVWRPSTGQWWILQSSVDYDWHRGYRLLSWGMPGDLPAPGDYDGDGKTDIGLLRASTGEWWILPSGLNYDWHQGFLWRSWGMPGDVPAVGDYDGDGRTDVALFRPTTGEWWVLPSSTGFDWHQSFYWIWWGNAGDQPVPGDYDGDGRTDAVLWRPTPGEWWGVWSRNQFSWQSGFLYLPWGVSTDLPVRR